MALAFALFALLEHKYLSLKGLNVFLYLGRSLQVAQVRF